MQPSPLVRPLPLAHIGLGPIGRQIASFTSTDARFQAAAAVDNNPDLAGCRLADLLVEGHPRTRQAAVSVLAAVEDLPPAPDGAVAVHCAGSSLVRMAPMLTRLLQKGYHVVSTCEELSNPWAIEPGVAAELDRVARDADRALVGTGVNPGFAMDYLPVVLSSSQLRVTAVRAHRVQDAGLRRRPLQDKVGAGCHPDEFARRVREGSIRHVGLPESVRLIDQALGLGCDEFTETIDPLVAAEPTPFRDGAIDVGRVLGIDQRAVGRRDGQALITLHLEMAVGLPDPRDEVGVAGPARPHLGGAGHARRHRHRSGGHRHAHPHRLGPTRSADRRRGAGQPIARPGHGPRVSR